MKTGHNILKHLIIVPLTLLCFSLNAQLNETLAINDPHGETTIGGEAAVTRFSNSESPRLSFMVITNTKDYKLHITTNYPDPFRIRFVDYYGRSIKVYRDISSNEPIDIYEFKDQIVILNITDDKNKLLSSQVVNLKHRKYSGEGELN